MSQTLAYLITAMRIPCAARLLGNHSKTQNLETTQLKIPPNELRIKAHR